MRWEYALLAVAMLVMFAVLVWWLTEDELRDLDSTHKELEHQRHQGEQQ